MDNNKIEIKIQPKSYYYFNLIKRKIISIIKPLIGVLIAIGALYIGFYVLLFFILFLGISYYVSKIKK